MRQARGLVSFARTVKVTLGDDNVRFIQDPVLECTVHVRPMYATNEWCLVLIEGRYVTSR